MTRTARSFLIATVALALLAAACGTDNADDAVTAPAPAAAGEPAWPHEFQGSLIGGGTIDTADYFGQDLVLWFWAPW